MEKIINIAIDGPSGAGKSSLAKKVAKKLGYVYVDTGAMYRTVALYIIRKGIVPKDAESVIKVLCEISLLIDYVDGQQHMFLNGEDVTSLIRTPEISMGASDVSAIPEVRAFLLETQRRLAREKSVVMDGRDIATVILPDAQVKIFLTADDRRRAHRRYLELREKTPDITFESVYDDMVNRDKNDSTRKVAPAIKAPDAVLLDNTDLDEDETLEKALSIIKDIIG